MTMTTDEALTKWCPFARVVGERPNGATKGCSCLGDGCMAWRWHLSPKRIAAVKTVDRIDNVRPTGYCGLAGSHGLD